MHTKVRSSGESLKVMWPSCGLKMASPDLSDTNTQLLKLVICPENKWWSSPVSAKFPAFLTKNRAIYFLTNLDRLDHIGLNMTVVFFERNIIQLLEHLPHKQTVEIPAVTACQRVAIPTSGIITISYEGCFPWQRLLSLVDKPLISFSMTESFHVFSPQHGTSHNHMNLLIYSWFPKLEKHVLLFNDASINKSPAMHTPFKTVW